MAYSIQQLAALAGISTRTLRHYDDIGLLSPARMPDNGYRIYHQAEVDALWHIMFYRQLGMPLADIRDLMHSDAYESIVSLQEHLRALKDQKEHLEQMIVQVEQIVAAMKGDLAMTDQEKFAAFKKDMVARNEAIHGEEARTRFGDTAVDHSNALLMNMSPEQYRRATDLASQINALLLVALKERNPAGETARSLCALHKEWLCCYWDQYSPEAHMNLATMYVEDPRFKAYYDALGEGCAEFLRDALSLYCAMSEESST